MHKIIFYLTGCAKNPNIYALRTLRDATVPSMYRIVLATIRERLSAHAADLG
jgi:hypothetical protein